MRRVADSELGFQQATLSRPSHAKTFLFVNTERMVVGCLVAEHIRQVTTRCPLRTFFQARAERPRPPASSVQAYRVLELPERHKDMTKDDFMERHRAWCCSTVPEPALCGISRIWVFSLARRRNIGTRMLDTLR